jgi:uncharacterized transporter YbjL
LAQAIRRRSLLWGMRINPAVQEAARSSVPSMGYGVAYAVGNVLLAIWGTVIVALMA